MCKRFNGLASVFGGEGIRHTGKRGAMISVQHVSTFGADWSDAGVSLGGGGQLGAEIELRIWGEGHEMVRLMPAAEAARLGRHLMRLAASVTRSERIGDAGDDFIMVARVHPDSAV